MVEQKNLVVDPLVLIGFSFVFKRNSKENINYDKISNDGKRLLVFMKENKGILENASIAMNIINKKDRATHKVIKELIDEGLIERIGSNKLGYWKIIDK